MAGEDAQLRTQSNGLSQSGSSLIEKTYHSLVEAHHQRDTKIVIKRCRNQDDPRTSVRFRNEVDALKAAIGHDNVAKILDFDSNQLTIALRLEPGLSLDKHVDVHLKSILPSSECTTIWRQMASALSYLHSLSIIHDDVKPDNIMWSREDQNSVLIDFGAALVKMPENCFNPSGTPNYAPPEFLHRKKHARGDIWGLGITMLFAFGYVPLPNGQWTLPIALEEGTEAHKEMSAWLAQVAQLRVELVESKPLVVAMLDADPDARIGSGELSRRLETV
ncbi:serine threonine protein kinase [Seiridium cupressi]